MAAVLPLLLTACGDDPFEPSVRYRALGYPGATLGVCPASGGDAAAVIAGASRARLTYIDATTDELRCDVVLDLEGPASVISVPDRIRPVDLTIEYLDEAGAVVGRGAVHDVDLAATSTVDVRVAATGTFSCGLDRASAPRAFHSATRLPGGEVLLLGGVAGMAGSGDGIEPGGGLFLQTTAEIWLPETGEIRSASIPGAIPRALHETWVVGEDAEGVVTIAVQGGISVTGDAATTAALVVGTDYRLEPSGAAIGASGELITYDPRTQTFTRMTMADRHVEPRGFGALTGAGPAFAAVGGDDLDTATVRATADHVSTTDGGRTATIGVRRPRLGGTATALDADRLLVWGGDVTADDGTGEAEVGELLVSWSTAPASAALAIDPGGEAGTHRAFHAAALAGDGAVIIAGGFTMTAGAIARVPAARVIQRVVPGATMQTITTLADDTTVAAFGYGAAATLPDGDVLITGGNPDAALAGCATDHQGLPCATAQALRYDTATGLVAATGSLGVPRYGHRMTPLADGMILVSGGLSLGATATTLRALPDVELYEPRSAADDPLLPEIVRAPGDVARTQGGEPLAPCDVIVVYDDAGAE